MTITPAASRYDDPIGPDAIDFDTFDFAAIRHVQITYSHDDDLFYAYHRGSSYTHINYSMVLAWVASAI